MERIVHPLQAIPRRGHSEWRRRRYRPDIVHEQGCIRWAHRGLAHYHWDRDGFTLALLSHRGSLGGVRGLAAACGIVWVVGRLGSRPSAACSGRRFRLRSVPPASEPLANLGRRTNGWRRAHGAAGATQHSDRATYTSHGHPGLAGEVGVLVTRRARRRLEGSKEHCFRGRGRVVALAPPLDRRRCCSLIPCCACHRCWRCARWLWPGCWRCARWLWPRRNRLLPLVLEPDAHL